MSSDLLQAVEMSLKAEKAKLEKATAHWTKVHDQLVEASTEVEASTTEVQRIESAVRALTGEADPVKSEKEVSQPKPPRKKKKRAHPDNPYATIPCTGCGEVGKLHEIHADMGGKLVRKMLCSGCDSETIL